MANTRHNYVLPNFHMDPGRSIFLVKTSSHFRTLPQRTD
jgi:hypothetical protein